MSIFLSKYGVARTIRIPVVKAGSEDHAASGDWTPAAGDVKIAKDGGAAANVTNLPTATAMGNSTIWVFALTATEMEAAQVVVTVADSAAKAVKDTGFEVETYGHASAQHELDLDAPLQSRLPAALTADGNIKADALKVAGADPEDAAAVGAVVAGLVPDGPDIELIVENALQNMVIEMIGGTPITLPESLRLKNAVAGGNTEGMDTGTVVIKSLDGAKDRVVATSTAAGRTIVSRDLT